MSENLRGSLFMVLAMLGFAIEDMLLKRVAAAGMPVGEILIFFGAGGCLLFAALTHVQGQPIWHPAVVSPRMLAKAGFEVMGRLFYTLAIAFTALSSASAILQATPLVVVAGAALIFGEKVGWRRWSAILLGLFGVLVILRPGLEGFTWASLLAVLGLLAYASFTTFSRGLYLGLAVGVMVLLLAMLRRGTWRVPVTNLLAWLVYAGVLLWLLAGVFQTGGYRGAGAMKSGAVFEIGFDPKSLLAFDAEGRRLR